MCNSTKQYITRISFLKEGEDISLFIGNFNFK